MGVPILVGISLPANPSHYPLSTLNQGMETSLVYKKLIAEFAGVPIGENLLMFRRATKNIRKARRQYALIKTSTSRQHYR